MTRNPSLLTSLALFALLGLAACEGGESSVCQLDDDCSSGLVCCNKGPALSDRGTCETACGATDAGQRDMSVPDLGGTDLGPEDLGGADLGPEDLGPVDAGDADAGLSEDLGTADMSVPLDLGGDGG
jgi:hypothetical protein